VVKLADAGGGQFAAVAAALGAADHSANRCPSWTRCSCRLAAGTEHHAEV